MERCRSFYQYAAISHGFRAHSFGWRSFDDCGTCRTAILTTFNFQPSNSAPFVFQATLDGDVYNVSVLWSLYRKDWYLQVQALDGTIIAYEALVGSPDGFGLQSLTWNPYNSLVTAITAAPHSLSLYKTMNLTISGCVPTDYNGTYSCFITGPSSFSYTISSNPGTATVFGSAAWNLNLVEPFFNTSSIVFLDSNNQFNVSP